MDAARRAAMTAFSSLAHTSGHTAGEPAALATSMVTIARLLSCTTFALPSSTSPARSSAVR
jgi:hypothetical protein